MNNNIMSIREMIDTAFGDQEVNIVNLKLVQAVLYILARQLRVLERRVAVELNLPYNISSEASLSVTEVKMQATVSKKRRKAKNVKSSNKSADETVQGKQQKPIMAQTPVVKKAGIKTTDNEPKSMKSERDEKESVDKSSSNKTTSKSTSDKTTTISTSEQVLTSKSTLEKTSDKMSSALKSKSEMSNFSVNKILETLEERREKQLRIIDQRIDSQDEGTLSPAPMESMDSVEIQKEKLLIVERKQPKSGLDPSTPQLSIVTQEQFVELAKVVQELQQRLNPVGTAEFPENIELLKELRKGASLTDAMSALQLSARLEAAEKALEKMTHLVTDLASRTPVVSAKMDATDSKKAEVVTGKKVTSKGSKKSMRKETSVIQAPKKVTSDTESESSEIIIPATKALHVTGSTMPPATNGALKEKDKTDLVTVGELEYGLEEIYHDIMKSLKSTTFKTAGTAETALKTALRLEKKVDEALDLGTRMEDLEGMVNEYAEQINVLDTGLSSQMTDHQEQLTQMQHDLETGLENMAESLANVGGDTTAVSELNTHFNDFQNDFENMFAHQKELRDCQDQLALDLQTLWKDIELLRETKSDREEVNDALRDKAGLGALNGLVTRLQFDAVCGDIEKRIRVAYEKFNNQEHTWQKVIDDLIRELNGKANIVQVESLRDSIKNHLNNLNDAMKTIFEIVGEPRAVAVSRRLFRDTECLSCSMPAKMDTEADTMAILPSLPARPPAIGAENNAKCAEKQRGDRGDGLCYPGFPVPHSIDPRSHVCRRYCGGSHTILTTTPRRVPEDMIVTPARRVTTAIGTDGRSYKVDELVTGPCEQCNHANIPPTGPNELEPETDTVSLPEDFGSATMPSMRMLSTDVPLNMSLQSSTPPPPAYDLS